MSKTASEWTEEGNAFDDEERLEEAVKCFDTAISIDPTFGRAYALKAYTIKKNDKFQEAADLNHKAIELGYKQDWVYNNLGQIYTFHIKKREEAIKMLDEALAISPNYADAFLNKGNALTALGKVKEANECFMKCINNNGNSAEACIMIGSALEDEGKKDEAMVYYNKGLEINSGDYKSRLLKANLLNEQGKTDEALTIYKSMLGDWPTDSIVNYQLSRIYTRLGKTEEATKCCEQAAKMNAENSAAYCAKGQCLNILGRAKEAMECFEKAKDLIENGTEVYASWFERSMKTALKAILEAEEVAKKVENELSKFDQNSKTVQKFKTNIKLLQEKKVNLQNQTIDQAGKKTTDGNNHQLSELDKIKADFQKQLDDLKKEMGEFKSEVKTEIKNLKNNMDEMKEELNSKMDDFNKKVDIELDKHDLSQEDKIKVKGYFAAFVGTFSSAHVSAQVVDSGQVSLDTDSTAATVLSFVASFTPFIGSALESGVKSIGDFLKGKEMKTNARKMKTLAADAVALSQLIGKAGFGIVQNKEKRDQIINITDRELDKQSGNLLEKMMKLCDDISEKLDAFLYTELYKTPAERLGHADANKLIEKWVNRKITPYSIHEQFIEIILYPATEKEIKPATEAPSAGRSSCCNLF